MGDEVGIIGGTGPLGRGLALRFAKARMSVRIGSRDPERAREIVAGLADRLGEDAARVVGVGNADATEAEMVVVAVPFEGLRPALEPLADRLRDRIVVSAVNPLAFDGDGPYSLVVPEGSAAELCVALLPGARVAAAFHSLSARQLGRLDEPMDDDVLVLSDDEDAMARTVELAARIDGVDGLAAGPLRLAAPLEGLTAALIAVNQRNRCHAGVRLTRVPR
jgi:8-hydroxy-5-deazaflavin:NADPH oxidoreductase